MPGQALLACAAITSLARGPQQQRAAPRAFLETCPALCEQVI